MGPAFTIALLAAVESLLSAVVADGMIGGRHRSNMELVAQGMANIASPLFGGIPATGAIARTATNVKNGGRTPVAGMVHAFTLLVITVAAGRWAAYIPMPTLAAILVVVAYHMSEWRSFLAELRSPKSDVAVLLTTFFLTVLVDLTVALEVGMVLAAFLFIRRMASVTNVSVITREVQQELAEDDGAEELLDRRTVPKGVEVYEINGPFFFGAAQSFKDAVSHVAGHPRVLILRMRNVSAMDSSGMHALLDVIRSFAKGGNGRHPGRGAHATARRAHGFGRGGADRRGEPRRQHRPRARAGEGDSWLSQSDSGELKGSECDSTFAAWELTFRGPFCI